MHFKYIDFELLSNTKLNLLKKKVHKKIKQKMLKKNKKISKIKKLNKQKITDKAFIQKIKLKILKKYGRHSLINFLIIIALCCYQ